LLKKKIGSKGVLTVEACISFTIFMMVILTILFIMRIVYVYALIQHATMQTAKELASYSYLYQVTGLKDLQQGVRDSAASGTAKFDNDASQVAAVYDTLMGKENSTEVNLESITTDPEQLLKNVASVFVGKTAADMNNSLFNSAARNMLGGYISPSDQSAADEKLKQLQVVGGLEGLDLSYSSFYMEGNKIDIVVCYTLDPLLPIDLMPEMNLMNRATVQCMNGESIIPE
jgi:hypothetical protein